MLTLDIRVAWPVHNSFLGALVLVCFFPMLAPITIKHHLSFTYWNWLAESRSQKPIKCVSQKIWKKHLHPGRLTWNLKTTCLKRKIIFQTISFRFHVNLPGVPLWILPRARKWSWVFPSWIVVPPISHPKCWFSFSRKTHGKPMVVGKT